jgi:hypothetical protein
MNIFSKIRCLGTSRADMYYNKKKHKYCNKYQIFYLEQQNIENINIVENMSGTQHQK